MKVINKKAKFNYKLFETYEAGISLTGVEVKTLLNGQVDLSNSYVKIIDGELYLINAVIPVSAVNANPTRTRKLLVHKNEITSIWSKIRQKQLTLVPTKLYNKGRRIKLEFALAKGKREYEKRQTIKKKDIEREIERDLKDRKT
jgi:SsrA-binding protein